MGASSGGGGGGSGDPRPRPTPENTAKDGMLGDEGTAGSPRPRPTDAVAEKGSAPSSSEMGLPGARGCPEAGRPRPRPCPKPPSPPPLPEEEEKAGAQEYGSGVCRLAAAAAAAAPMLLRMVAMMGLARGGCLGLGQLVRRRERWTGEIRRAGVRPLDRLHGSRSTVADFFFF